MPRRSLHILIAALLLSLVAAGCGGGTHSGTSPSATTSPSGGSTTTENPGSQHLSKAEFIKKADVICEETDKLQTEDLAALSLGHSGTPGKAEQEGQITRGGLPPIQNEAERISELGPPRGDEQKISTIVEGIEEAVRKARNNPSILLGGSSSNPFAKVDNLAREYGFKACSSAL